MNRFYRYLLLFLFLSLANCSDFKKGLGFEKDVPNEFLIRKTDPIERPPNFELLPPDSKVKKNKKVKVNTSQNTKSLIDKSIKKNSVSNESQSSSTVISNIEDSVLKNIKK